MLLSVFTKYSPLIQWKITHHKYSTDRLKIFKIIINFFIIMYSPYLLSNITLAPLSFKKSISTISNDIQNKIKSLNVVKYSDIENFIRSHPEIKNSYYDEFNPAYPQGCESYSYILSEELEKEGIEHIIILTTAHYYILILVEFPDGVIKDVILDYTADQVIGKAVSPLLETREILEILYPESYKKYWKPLKIVARDDIKFDGSYLIYTEIVSLMFYKRNELAISS